MVKTQESETNGISALKETYGTDPNFKRKILWPNVVVHLFLHVMAAYGLYLYIFKVGWYARLWGYFIAALTGEGIVMGAHRLYTHRAYKAKWPLRAFLIFWQTAAGQNSMWTWVRDHRQHHKYSDTDADPHNSTRGFFFCHAGWLMSKKHPLAAAKAKTIDMSDIEADPMVMFQKKYYFPLYVIAALFVPVYFPMYMWGETFVNSLFVNYFFRYVYMLHVAWTVNSLAHLYGNRPFDKTVIPVENKFVSFVSYGEGYHNYHHTFPWDYRASEYGVYFSPTTIFIDICHYLGLITDLREVSPEVIKKRIITKGDGTHSRYQEFLMSTNEK